MTGEPDAVENREDAFQPSTTHSAGGGAVVTASRYDGETLSALERDAAQILARYPDPRSGLLPLLHLVQSVDGYVSRNGIVFCAEQLGLTPAEVSAVATFYTQYKRKPNGTYTVGVCTNTLCAVMGGDEIFARLSEHLGIGHDETTDDGAITLERVECNAACDYAPVLMVNWEFFDNQTPESAAQVTDTLRQGGQVRPTRGADSVCSFKQMSRVLAGFTDDRAHEGVGAGGPSLAGLRIIRESGSDQTDTSHTAAASGATTSLAEQVQPTAKESGVKNQPVTSSSTEPEQGNQEATRHD